MLIPHSKPHISEDDIKAVSRVLKSGHIAQGEKVKEFEATVAQYVGVKYAVAVASGTSAIHLALIAFGLKPNDEVIIPSYVCASLYMAILHAGAKPRIVDIDPETFNISVKSVKEKLTSNTKVIIVPHMFGNPADIEEIVAIGIPVIEDCAQSLGAEYKNKRVGSFGKVAICSFYATKLITTGEGGMALTSDSKIHEKILDRREYDKESVDEIRYNYKMTDFQAALGISQLKKLDLFINRRQEIAAIYHNEFSGYDITLPRIDKDKKPIFYRYVIQHKKINEIQKAAKYNGIICERPVRKPLHQNFPSIKCPNTDYVFKRALSIPLYPSLTEGEVEFLVKNMKIIFDRSKK